MSTSTPADAPRHRSTRSAPDRTSPFVRSLKRIACAALAPCLLAACERAPLQPRTMHTHRSGEPGDVLGQRLAAAGDVDGDGVLDVALGATRFARPLAPPGYVLVLSGRDGSELLRLQGEDGADGFGDALLGLPDVDGDGAPELIVGSPLADAGGPDAGSVQLISTRSGERLWTAVGERGGDGLGIAVAALGDIDGDGIPDLAASALQPPAGPDRDAGPGYIHALSGATGALLFVIRGDDQNQDLGRQLAPLGDLDGDGLPDLAASAPGSQAILLLSGRDGSVLHRVTAPGAGFGDVLVPLGDVDGDGLPDLAVGAALESQTHALGGAVHLLSGADASTLLVVRGETVRSGLGRAVAGLPDLDGDDVPDFAASAAITEPVRLYSGRDGRVLAEVAAEEGQYEFGAGLAGLQSPGEPTPDDRAWLAIGFPGTGPDRELAGGVLWLTLETR